MHGMKQAKLCALTGWDKRKASELVTGKQRYNRDSLNEAAGALQIRPFELLMHPSDAMALKRLRDTAVQIAADPGTAYDPGPRSQELSFDAAAANEPPDHETMPEVRRGNTR